jgi:hypothetical protein
MKGWQKYFRLKGIRPGKVHVSIPNIGIVDFTDILLDLDLLRKLWEADFPYLEPTEEGYKIIYGIDLDTSASNLAKMIRNASDLQEATLFAAHKPDSKIVNQALEAYKSKSL